MKRKSFATFLISLLLVASFFTVFPIFEIPLVHAAGITRVHGNDQDADTYASSLNVTLANTPTSGNILVAVIGTHSNDTYRTVSSIAQTGITWTEQYFANGAGYQTYASVEIWAGVVGAGASTELEITLSGTASSGVVADVCEYSGVATSDFLDQMQMNGDNWYDATTGTTGTTSQADELWIGGFCVVASANITDPTNGFSLLDGYGGWGGGFAVAYTEKIVSSVGTAESSVNSVGALYAACIVTLKAEAPTPPSANLISVSSVTNATSCTFASNWTADSGLTLSGFIFGCNASGSWSNETWTSFSGSTWANKTKTLPSSVGVTVQFRWWANDSDNVWGDSELQNLFTLSSGFLQVEGSKVQSSVVAGTNSSKGIMHQEKSFYAAGRFWVFFVGEYTSPNYAYYTSSTDGLSWADPVSLNVGLAHNTGTGVQVLLSDSGILHIFNRGGGGVLYYGSATPNSNGSLTWLSSMAEKVSPSGGGTNTDFNAALDADGYPWIIWAWGSSLSNQTVYAYKSQYNNGTWSLDSGFPISVTSAGLWTNNMIIPFSNGDMYFFYYRAGTNPIYGKLWNGTLGSQETCSTSSIFNDYPEGSESWSRAWTVDDDDNIFLSFLNTNNELVIAERTFTDSSWGSEAVVQTDVIDGASPSLNWVNGFLNLFWVHDISTIANEVVDNAVPLSETLTYSAIVGQIPLFDAYGDSGRLNAFTSNFNGQPALLYITNMTLPTSPYYTYQICFGLFDFDSYVITTSAGAGGSISPSGDVYVLEGFSQDFEVTPNATYNLATVQIDGGPNLNNNTDGMTIHFTNVVANHTLSATFSGPPLPGSEYGSEVPSTPDLPSGENFAISDMDLGKVAPNSTVKAYLSVAFSSVSFRIATVVFSPPFNQWLLETQDFQLLTGGSGTLQFHFRIPANASGRYEGTITVSGFDAHGITHTAQGKITAQVGESGFNLAQWIRDNPILVILAVAAVVAVLAVLAVYKRRR